MSNRQRVLVVDDEPDIRELLEITLNRMAVSTRSVADLHNARQALTEESFNLCLTDMNLPDGSGLELVSEIQERYPDTPVAVITAYGSIDTAISALKSGAFDFVSKPIELERLRSLVETALKLPRSGMGKGLQGGVKLSGQSTASVQLKRQIGKLARSQAPVHISGESGSGKELVAHLIHSNGPRAEQAFIAVNCGAIPSELMESEFFGHKKGAFTGAVADKAGLFQAANGGTLFLDEVADLPLEMQVKLLRAIQEKSVRAVGDQRESAIDVRLLSATHKNLEQEVANGRFRQDLFYRINVIELAVPPLRERREDIRLIATEVLASLDDGRQWTLDEAAWQTLENYSFPGNIRELRNILERACTLSESSTITNNDLGLTLNSDTEQNIPAGWQRKPEAKDAASHYDPAKMPLEEYLQTIERRAIEEALQETRWNKTAAAEKLGMSFRALRYRLKKLGID